MEAIMHARAAGLLTLFAVAASAQSFDVSTVKPNASGTGFFAVQIQPGGRLSINGLTLKMLIAQAYEVRDFQITGGPSWMNTERWDIVAKAEGVTDRLPREQFAPMLRKLIEERFQLKAHRDTREMPVYALVEAKGGSKLKEDTDPSTPGPQMRQGRGQAEAKKINMPMVAQMLSQQVGRPVIDKTGLKGAYDFTLNWTPDPGSPSFGPPGVPPPGVQPPPPPPADGPSLFTALQEQLGLRLDSTKGPADVVVIDSVDKPTDN